MIPDPSGVVLVLVSAASFAAGFVDAVAGGGGLILLPALLAAFPSAPPVVLLAGNKLAAVFGTAMATTQFALKLPRPRFLLVAFPLALVTSFFGAWTALSTPPSWLRLAVVPALLLAAGFLVFRRPGGEGIRETTTKKMALFLVGAAAVGFYDGFLGPGTGIFLLILATLFAGSDLLSASLPAKALNLASNLGALVLFGFAGVIPVKLGLILAASNLAGAFFGSRLALKKGRSFIRGLAVAVCLALIAKILFGYFFPAR